MKGAKKSALAFIHFNLFCSTNLSVISFLEIYSLIRYYVISDVIGDLKPLRIE